MPEIGNWLSSEEHSPRNLVQFAARAEASGFTFALISDHFHPWIDRQGQAPFVCSVIGGIAQVTKKLRLGTGVTCPTICIHPAIIAQAATAATMMPGRFFLGVGTGENRNEHIVGDGWPPIDIRQEMLEEAIEIIRLLWQGESQTFYGDYYKVEDARIYTLPDTPSLLVAASGERSAEIAAQAGDGLIGVDARANVVKALEAAGGSNKPRIGKVAVCWAEDKATALETVREVWPVEGLPGVLMPELRAPTYFDQAVKLVTDDALAQAIVLGPDPEAHLLAIRELQDAGFDQVALHQIGANQEEFFNFYEQHVLPVV